MMGEFLGGREGDKERGREGEREGGREGGREGEKGGRRPLTRLMPVRRDCDSLQNRRYFFAFWSRGRRRASPRSTRRARSASHARRD